MWMSYGLINGKSTEERDKNSNNTVNMILMSLGDGLIGVLQIYIVYKLYGSKVLKKWDWKALSIIFIIGIVQNLIVTGFVYEKVKGEKISWAPLMPVQTNSIVQIQEPWIIQPFILYAILLGCKFVK